MTSPKFTMRHRLIIIVILVVANALIWTDLLTSEPDDGVGRVGDVVHALPR